MIKVGWMKFRNAFAVLCDKKILTKLKGKFYRMAVRPAIIYGAKCGDSIKQHKHNIVVAEMRILRWMYGHTSMNRIINENILKLE